jgi:hypothetical protein
MSPRNKETFLTEQQARTLAHWWGGKYQQIRLPEGENPIRHGVLIAREKSCQLQGQTEAVIRVFSLEEAREMENRRGFQEAASPDWVG